MVYTDIDLFVKEQLRLTQPQRFILDKHKKYLRIGCGFDIETTRKDLHAYMYIWQFSYGEHIIIGRTWWAYSYLIEQIRLYLDKINGRLIVWVANLGHEFAFIGRRYHWDKVFAKEAHQPLLAVNGRIEYREALSISGQGGLKNLAKNYTQTQKAVGDLNYNIPRNSQTPLDDTEMGYVINDVRILAEWGEYIFKAYSDNKKQIPMTATGIVRNSIKKAAYATGHIKEISEAVKQMYPNRETYNFIMMFLFRGGYTHANAWWVLVVWDSVIGADYTSSYPSVMLCPGYYYPKSEFLPCRLETDGKHITDKIMDECCVWFVAIFRGIRRTTMHTVESEHKIIKYENATFDNGRLIGADMVRVALTELDYLIYLKFYDWDSIEIQRAYKAVRGPLPEYVLKPLREAYQTKARLKKWAKERGINPDTIPEYRNAKATINSYYGVMVQRLCFTEYLYDEQTGKWSEQESKKTYRQMIAHSILNPYWGIYVTAWARYNILSTIGSIDTDETGNIVIYSDTDSIYGDDCPAFRQAVEKYNEIQIEKNKKLPPEFADIGCFDWIGGTDDQGNPQRYKFKTLGAKRYIKYHDGEAEVTVAGMRKGSLEHSILRQFATDNSYILYKDQKHKTGKLGYIDINELFGVFSDSFCLECDESWKNRAAYDVDYEDDITDPYGNTEHMSELSGAAIVPVCFSIEMKAAYLLLLGEIAEQRRRPIWQ